MMRTSFYSPTGLLPAPLSSIAADLVAEEQGLVSRKYDNCSGMVSSTGEDDKYSSSDGGGGGRRPGDGTGGEGAGMHLQGRNN